MALPVKSQPGASQVVAQQRLQVKVQVQGGGVVMEQRDLSSLLNGMVNVMERQEANHDLLIRDVNSLHARVSQLETAMLPSVQYIPHLCNSCCLTAIMCSMGMCTRPARYVTIHNAVTYIPPR